MDKEYFQRYHMLRSPDLHKMAARNRYPKCKTEPNGVTGFWQEIEAAQNKFKNVYG